MSKLHRGLVAAALTLCMLAAAGSASADLVPPPSLQGEQFVGGTFATDSCGPDRTFMFSVEGVAVGPYTGDFTETGTVAVGPPTGPTTLVSFDAEFTITVEDVTVV